MLLQKKIEQHLEYTYSAKTEGFACQADFKAVEEIAPIGKRRAHVENV